MDRGGQRWTEVDRGGQSAYPEELIAGVEISSVF